MDTESDSLPAQFESKELLFKHFSLSFWNVSERNRERKFEGLCFFDVSCKLNFKLNLLNRKGEEKE